MTIPSRHTLPDATHRTHSSSLPVLLGLDFQINEAGDDLEDVGGASKPPAALDHLVDDFLLNGGSIGVSVHQDLSMTGANAFCTAGQSF